MVKRREVVNRQGDPDAFLGGVKPLVDPTQSRSRRRLHCLNSKDVDALRYDAKVLGVMARSEFRLTREEVEWALEEAAKADG